MAPRSGRHGKQSTFIRAPGCASAYSQKRPAIVSRLIMTDRTDDASQGKEDALPLKNSHARYEMRYEAASVAVRPKSQSPTVRPVGQIRPASYLRRGVDAGPPSIIRCVRL